ncbi:MAG: bacteriohemerythrin [Motiliproteus sp.]|nr:bacteriohemerythrin [Motiliproteus sp.]MCW9052851.1 bacteriohemerythrin [Motiliproteus sp.]
MDKFVFDDSLRLGITLIDEQHGRFIGYINDTWDALERGDSKEEFLHILNQLMDYVVEHFSDEEALMKEFDYPGLAEHRDKHSDTTDELFGFDMKLMGDDPEAARSFLNFLTDWLRNHINVVDRELAAYLKEKGCS